ncbi:MAG: hypothetical protein AAFO07_08745 [Bacteroidota bacterium]
MKKSKTNVLVAFVILASLSSYLFLYQVGSNIVSNQPAQQAKEELELEAADSKMSLPDVQMVKKVLETGRRLIPAS